MVANGCPNLWCQEVELTNEQRNTVGELEDCGEVDAAGSLIGYSP